VNLLANCPGCSRPLAYEYEGRKYRREFGVEIRGVYDGVLYWVCPNCRARWHRFPEGDPIRDRAEPYVSGERP